MLIIDGDLYVYKAGFANRKNELGHKIIHRVTHEERDYGFCSQTAVFEKLKADGIDNREWRLTPYMEPGALEYALANVKLSLNSLLEHFNTTDYELYLTSTDNSNYRFNLATIQPYKGTRSRCKHCFAKVRSRFANSEQLMEISCDVHGVISKEQTVSDRPVYFNEIRDYLINYWKAIVIYEQEADDMVSIRSLEVPGSVMVHIDKDINNTPGKHYNPDKKIDYEITSEAAISHFYRQILLGDKVDNIPGVSHCGEKTVDELFKNCYSEEDHEEIILGVFRGCHYDAPRFNKLHTLCLTKEEAWSRLREVGQLLWIRRERDEYWEPKIRI